MRIGLRIDVDTLRGTRVGVPNLSRSLAEREIRATFFFSVGPDNMGRHVWRLMRPAFLWKMLRSNAPGLYGWDILLRGTLWPGPRIGRRLAHVIREAAADGHEIGFHAWDHHAWQAKVDAWDDTAIRRQLRRGVDELTGILGRPPGCSADPGWRSHERVLEIKQSFPFTYNSDCRGVSIFAPALAGRRTGLRQCQVPVTLPTYDEVVGREGVTSEGYYRLLESRLDPGGLNVLAVHAEVEGIRCLAEFERFVDTVRERGWSFVPLAELVAGEAAPPLGRIERSTVPGREGWIARQATVS